MYPYEPEKYVRQIGQLFPAEGWRVFQCMLNQNDEAEYREYRVIGWAVVRTLRKDGELDEDCWDELELMVFNGQRAITMSEMDHWMEGDECESYHVQWQEPLSPETKAEMEKNVRYQIRHRYGPKEVRA